MQVLRREFCILEDWCWGKKNHVTADMVRIFGSVGCVDDQRETTVLVVAGIMISSPGRSLLPMGSLLCSNKSFLLMPKASQMDSSVSPAVMMYERTLPSGATSSGRLVFGLGVMGVGVGLTVVEAVVVVGAVGLGLAVVWGCLLVGELFWGVVDAVVFLMVLLGMMRTSSM